MISVKQVDSSWKTLRPNVYHFKTYLVFGYLTVCDYSPVKKKSIISFGYFAFLFDLIAKFFKEYNFLTF